MIKNFITKYPILLIILVLAFIIRCVAGYVQSFSNDELSALYRLQYSNFHDLLHWGIKVDGHPALVQLFLNFYTQLVPKAEIWIRLPFIVAGTTALIFIFFSLKKLSGEFTAYMVTIILAFAGFSIQLGYFARPYAFGILFISAATYYWIRIFIGHEKSKKYLFLFTLFSILASYTHYFALLHIVILGAASFLFAPLRIWWKMVLAGLITFIAFVPHFPITAFQMSVGGIGGWLGKPEKYFIVDVLFEFFDRSALLVGVFVFIPMILITQRAANPKIKRTLLFLFLSIVPFYILYFYSIKVNSVLQFSACFFLMPFLLAAFFSLFESKLEAPKFIKWTYVGAIIVFLTSTLYSYNVFAPIHFAEFKRIAQYIEEHESDSVTTVVAVNNPFYIDYYLKDKKPDLYITDMGDNLSFLKRYIDTCGTKEFIYAFSNDRSNGEIPFMINDEFSTLLKKQYYLNSELYHFDKNHFVRSDELFDSKYNYTYMQEYTQGKGSFETVMGCIPPGGFTLNDSVEFSPTLELKTGGFTYHNKVVARVTGFQNDSCDVQLVISFEDNNQSKFWRSRKLSFQSRSTQKEKELTRYYICETLNDPEIDLKNGILKVYVWNPNHCNCRLDNFEISVIAGNPYTTGY